MACTHVDMTSWHHLKKLVLMTYSKNSCPWGPHSTNSYMASMSACLHNSMFPLLALAGHAEHQPIFILLHDLMITAKDSYIMSICHTSEEPYTEQG